MVTPFAVHKYDDGGGRSRLMVTGEIDNDTGEGLATLIGNAAEQDGVTMVIVDLRHVTVLAAAGVRALLKGHAAAHARGCGYLVTNPRGMVSRVLAITGAAEFLSFAALQPETVETQAPG